MLVREQSVCRAEGAFAREKLTVRRATPYNITEMEKFNRTEMLLGPEAMKKLAACRVAIFGLGGVGGHAMEALVRSGIGAVDIIDHDRVDETNLNRQILATTKTIGRYKVDVAEERIREINPECIVTKHCSFFLPETKDLFAFGDYDYVLDAIDTVAGKLALIEAAREAKVPVICSMGAGNKLDASAFRVADIYDTKVCPLAKVIRRECRKREIDSLKVVYSEEEPLSPTVETGSMEAGVEAAAGKRPPGSVAFVPAAAGLIMAGEVVRDLCARNEVDGKP